MDSWILSLSLRDIVLDAAFIGSCLLAGTILRKYVGLFQRFLIPNSLLAGFVGLIVGPEVLGMISFPVERMGAYVYHLLALTFICVGLHGGGQRHSYGAVNLGFMQITSMLLQGMIGLVIALIVMATLDGSVVPAVGMLLPLGFAMGPGIAYSVGQSWSTFGFAEGGAVGLTLAAVGFLIAYGVGVVLVHREHTPSETLEGIDTGIRPPGSRPSAGSLTFFPSAIEPLTVHISIIGAVYLATYVLVSFLAGRLEASGLASEVPILWSFHFILANLLALATRYFMRKAGTDHVMDDGLLHRVTGLLADFLIAASIMAISLSLAVRYALPIALMVLVGGYVTYWMLRRTSSIVFRAHRFERFIGMFGEMTGTVTSGLALIRITDPEYRSPVAQDLVLSSGMALGLGFPLLLVINLPFTLFDGALYGYGVVLAIMLAYLILILFAWRLFFRRASEADLES